MSRRHACVIALLLAASCAGQGSAATSTSITVSPIGSSIEIPATLIKPDGDGPFPAVVIAHDCSGLGPRSSGSPARWAAELVGQGYVVMIPDSFTPRGFAEGVCLVPSPQQSSVYSNVRAADAYGALAALRAMPFVDGKRIGMMGGSHGGSTTLAAMVVPVESDNPLSAVKRDGFAASIALYPGCGSRYGAWSVFRHGRFGLPSGYSGAYQPIAPLLILIGEKDDWTPAEPCRQMAERSRAAGYPVDIKIYPDSLHSFDNDRPVRYDARRNNGNSPSGFGATTGGNVDAWVDAKKQVAEFFARYLKQ